MSEYPAEQQESEYLHTALLEYQRDTERLTVELTAARAELAKAHRRIHGDDSEDCVFCASKKQTPGGDDPQCCLCALEAELAALRAEQAKPQWLPIENAPRDGTHIITYECDKYSVLWIEEAWWFEGKWEPADEPTHWMPLPAPPRDLREGGE